MGSEKDDVQKQVRELGIFKVTRRRGKKDCRIGRQGRNLLPHTHQGSNDNKYN